MWLHVEVHISITGGWQMQENVNVGAVIDKVKNEMGRLAYSDRTIEAHELVWGKFQNYANKRGSPNFTAEIAEDFLRDTFNYPQIFATGKIMPQAIRNRIRAIRVLQDFHFLGVMPGKLLPPTTHCPDPFNAIYEKTDIHSIIETQISCIV
jgi:hypothetical protein